MSGVQVGTSMRPGNRQRGFTLIEVMIVVVVIGILAGIAYPSYRDQVERGKRTEAQAKLTETAQRLERCYTAQNSYQECIDDDDLPLESEGGSYEIGFETGPTDIGFKLAATPTPQGGQTSDDCGTLTLDQAGRRDAKEDDCW